MKDLCVAGAGRKPNSVSLRCRDGNHSSSPRVAPGIQRSTQKHRTGRPYPLRGSLFYLTLLRVGFAVPPLLPVTRCALTAPFHPYPRCRRRYVFCGTFRRVAPPSRYEAHCPVEFGLSSALRTGPRLPGRLRRYYFMPFVREAKEFLRQALMETDGITESRPGCGRMDRAVGLPGCGSGDRSNRSCLFRPAPAPA